MKSITTADYATPARGPGNVGLHRDKIASVQSVRPPRWHVFLLACAACLLEDASE